MKVFFFIPSLIQGGAQRQLLELVRRLPPPYQPVLALWNDDDMHFRGDLPPGQPRHVLGTHRMTGAAFDRLVDILRAERPAIFHSFLNDANFWGRRAALRAGVPIIISSVRARMIELRYLLFERYLTSRCQLVTCNSVGIQRELTGLARVPPEKIRIVHNFIDLERFRPPTDDERAAARARWQIPEKTRLLLMPGRISVQKHQVGLLLALSRLARGGRLPDDVVVLLPGRQRDAFIDRLVLRLARGRRLRDVVRVPGAETDMRSLYWAADLMVLPSLWEGLPNVALEAAASGLPALLSHAANLDGIVAEGETGWEAPTGDHFALADKLEQALSVPRDRWRVMGENARLRMRRLFHADAILAQTLAIYDELLASTGGQRNSAQIGAP